MIMGPDKKKIATMIIAGMDDDEMMMESMGKDSDDDDDDDSTEAEGPKGLAADAVLEAIDEHDPKALVKALESFVSMCQGPQTEYYEEEE